MASTFIREELPIAVVAPVGSSVSLSSILTQAFGANFDGYSQFWIEYYGTAELQTAFALPLSYWDPVHPSISSWAENGVPLPVSTPTTLNQQYLTSNQVDSYSLQIGNDIYPFVYLVVPVTVAGGATEYIQYDINVVAPGLQNPTAENGLINPSDIVGTAYRYAAAYSGVLNNYDCHDIAGDVAAAAGAPFVQYLTESTDPTQNVSSGFWRVVYRGSDPNPVADWQTLVQPGDIVRMAWQTGSFHTTTILSDNPDGSITVFDNGDYNSAGQNDIGIHTVNYDTATIPGSITIYRLSPDHLYLIQGTDQSEILNGSQFNNEIHTGAGNDTVNGGPLNDFIYLDGSGTKTVDGGAGLNTVILSGATTDYSDSDQAGVITVSGSGIAATLTNIERVQFSNAVIAFDVQGDAGNAYRLYQAAFDRTPDTAGLSFWTHQLDEGVNIQVVAQDFVNSSEFKSVYGTNPTNDHIVDLFYQNVLGRLPDQAGLAFWVNQLNAGTSVGAVLEGFAVSSENHGLVDPKLVLGIVLDQTAFLV